MVEFGAYDEAEIAGRLKELRPEGRAQFACACAERLMVAFRWFCDVSDCANFEIVRKALDAAWAGPGAELLGPQSADDIAGIVPEDQEGDMALGSAVAQNAVASVVYALEVRHTGEAETAVWAARQLYDAADAVVQKGAAEHTYLDDIDREQPVQLMVLCIHAVLDAIQAGALAADLITNAQRDGHAFLAFVSGNV